jgi:hypothetical protein
MTLHVASRSAHHLLEVAGGAYTAGDIAEHELVALDPDGSAEHARARLTDGDLDVAPVAGQPITRIVTREALANTADATRVADAAEALTADGLVTASTPLIAVLDRLEHRQAVFVFEHQSSVIRPVVRSEFASTR